MSELAELVKLARVYVWSGAIARVLLALAPLALAFSGISISLGGAN